MGYRVRLRKGLRKRDNGVAFARGGRMSKLVISMPDKFLEEVDEFAKQEQRTRSELIREALRKYMNKAKNVNALQNASLLDKLLD
jgi:predicted DNA-binding protein